VPTGEIELRNSEAWLLGKAEQGIYLILEVLNSSRVANAMGSVGLAQRALADALSFAQKRIVFGRPLIEQPLMRRQFEDRVRELQGATRLAWVALRLLNETWQERPPYSDRFHLFRLVTHLAKYWTAEFAVQTAKWAMEVHGGMGTLQEFRAERWLREAMILAIWEGPSHRQILDGLEVMERKRAHELLFQMLRRVDLEQMRSKVERHLALPQAEKEAGAGELFADLAAFTAEHIVAEAK
jgi:alkylation response protein AidB-like acyl-CoA dehydrogenase